MQVRNVFLIAALVLAVALVTPTDNVIATAQEDAAASASQQVGAEVLAQKGGDAGPAAAGGWAAQAQGGGKSAAPGTAQAAVQDSPGANAKALLENAQQGLVDALKKLLPGGSGSATQKQSGKSQATKGDTSSKYQGGKAPIAPGPMQHAQDIAIAPAPPDEGDDADKTGTGVISGKVLNAEGRGVRDVWVVAELLDPDQPGQWESRGDAFVQTGMDGAYKITGLPAGEYLVQIIPLNEDYLRGFYGKNGAVVLGDDEALRISVPDGESVKLPAARYTKSQLAATISGVVAADGAPLPDGTWIAVYREDDNHELLYGCNSGLRYDSETGAYSISGLEAGAYYVRVLPYSSGYAPKYYVAPGVTSAAKPDQPPVTVGAGEEATGIDMDIAGGGGVIAGTVYDQNGKPVQGVNITIIKSHPGLNEYTDYYCETGADGSFKISGLPEGKYFVEFWDRPSPTEFGHVFGYYQAGVENSLVPGETGLDIVDPVIIEFDPAPTEIHGIAVTIPAEGDEIAVTIPEQPEVTFPEDPADYIVIEFPGEDGETVQVEIPETPVDLPWVDIGPEQPTEPVQVEEPILVEEPVQVEEPVLVEEPAQVEIPEQPVQVEEPVQVVISEEPVQVEVTEEPVQVEVTEGPAQTEEPGSSGDYVVVEIPQKDEEPAEDPVEVDIPDQPADQPDGLPWVTIEIQDPADEADVEKGTGAISGKVLDENGAGFGGAWVLAEWLDPARPGYYESRGDSFVHTGKDGSYKITGLPDGEYIVQIIPSYTSYLRGFYGLGGKVVADDGDAVRFTVKGDTLLLPPVRYDKSQAEATISGTLTAGGKPLPSGTWISIYREEDDHEQLYGYNHSQYYDASTGAYSVSELAAGEYYVRVIPYGSGYAPVYYAGPGKVSTAKPAKPNVTVEAGQTAAGIDLDLAGGGGVIAGVVYDTYGEPFGGLNVSVIKNHPDLLEYTSFSCKTEADGSFKITGLPEGEYYLEFWERAPGLQFGYVHGYYQEGLEGSLRPGDGDISSLKPITIDYTPDPTEIEGLFVEIQRIIW
ncbi:MAG: carboxypeptidase regulatory-like domain-containing protein [Clostridiales Family XIII bacterium]|jgi:hypothetical protein|nr:carboxypeptidase regulatory-like domain-containing protein [Clostridiales Family XIII bacterium]